MSYSCKAVVYLLLALPAVAHSQAFAKITIRPASSADPRNMRMQVLPNGDLIANAVPVIMLLSYAYDVPVDPSPRLSPLPDWTIRESYDIEGKGIANAITPSLQGSDSRSRIQQKIRGLLADRFRLAMRSRIKRCQFMLSPLPAVVRSFRSQPSPIKSAPSIPTRKVAITLFPASAIP